MSRQELTVDDIRKAIEGVDGSIKVKLTSDTGVDQGEGIIYLESVSHIKSGDTEYISIYAVDSGSYD